MSIFAVLFFWEGICGILPKHELFFEESAEYFQSVNRPVLN